MRVYLWNKEEKVLFFKNYDLTAQQICNEMAKKNLLTQDSRPLFSLWIVGNNLGPHIMNSFLFYFFFFCLAQHVLSHCHCCHCWFVCVCVCVVPAELQLKPSQDVFEVVEKFPRYVEKYTHYSGPVDWKFYYKREALLTKNDERKTKDPSAIKLLFSEVWRHHFHFCFFHFMIFFISSCPISSPWFLLVSLLSGTVQCHELSLSLR